MKILLSTMVLVWRFFQLDGSVSKSCVKILLIFFTVSANSQDVYLSRYNLMSEVISQDTVIEEITYRIISDKIRRGLLSKDDSLRYITTVKNKKLLLFKYENNKNAKKSLQLQLKENGIILSYLTKEVIKRIIKNIPGDRKHDLRIFGNDFTVVGPMDSWSTYHSFSSPVEIEENRFIMYHDKHISCRNTLMEFIIFGIQNKGGYEIENRIVVYSH